MDFTTSAPPPSWEGPAPADGPPVDEDFSPGERVRSPSEKSEKKQLLARDAEPPPPESARVVPVDDAARREIVRRLVEFGEKAGFLRVSSETDRFLGE